MRPRTVALLLVLVLALLFAALNWAAFAAPARLNVLFGTVEAPVGVLMLAALGALTVVYLILLVRAEGSALLETRRLSRDRDRAQKLADESELSRLVRLEAKVEEGFARLDARLAELAGGGRTPPRDARRDPDPPA